MASAPYANCPACRGSGMDGDCICACMAAEPPETRDEGAELANLSVGCGQCGGPVYFVTCNGFRGTGHDWVIVGICGDCRETNWTEGGCIDCNGVAK